MICFCTGLLQIWPISFVPFLVYIYLFVGVAYSTLGLTREVLAFSLISLLEILRFLLKNPIVSFALAQMFLIWFCHLRSDVIVTLKYFADVTCSRVWLWLVFWSLLPIVPGIYLDGISSSIILPIEPTCLNPPGGYHHLVTVMYAIVSSAKSLMVDSIFSGMSLI